MVVERFLFVRTLFFFSRPLEQEELLPVFESFFFFLRQERGFGFFGFLFLLLRQRVRRVGEGRQSTGLETYLESFFESSFPPEPSGAEFFKEGIREYSHF